MVENLTGKVFNRLTVIKRLPNDKHQMTQWLCQCIDGNLCNVSGPHLRSGHTKSCGCLNKEQAHTLQASHGQSRTKLYKVWNEMIQRCTNSMIMQYDQLQDMFDQVLDKAFEAVDRAELKKEDVLAVLQDCIQRINEGYFDAA